MRTFALSLAAVAACSTAGEAAAPSPPTFEAVHSLLLVRSRDAGEQRPRDPLDGLQETLRARGFSVRMVDLGKKPPSELAPLERLFGQLEARAASGTPDRRGAGAGAVSHDAGALVARLGVDAVASYHRLDRRRLYEFPPEALPGAMFPPPPTPPQRAVGALMLVDREGHIAAFPWGGAGPVEDPSVPVNAAEAIELLVRVLSAEPSDE